MKSLFPLILILFCSLAFADADATDDKNGNGEKETKKISAEIEIGVILTSGNTESTAGTAKIDISQDFTKWKNNYIVSAFYKEDEVTLDVAGEEVKEMQTTADKIFASMQSDYKLDNEHKALFAYVSYEDDQFSGFDYQSTVAVGYSNRLFETENSHFDYSVGPGLAIAKTEETVDDDDNIIPAEKTETFAVRLSGSYLYRLSEHAKITQKISGDVAGDSEKNTKIKSETGLTATINGSMALKLSYVINHNTKPPFEKEKTDTTTAVTLVFTY